MILPVSMQQSLFSAAPRLSHRNSVANKLAVADRRFHDWYRFVLSFPPHLAREYFTRFGLKPGDKVLDPFCGTGTTLVEAKLQGLSSIGIEANPMAHFASAVKIDWRIAPDALLEHATELAQRAQKKMRAETKLRSLPADALSLLLKDSISPLPLHNSMVLLEEIEKTADSPFYQHQRLAFAKALVFSISNLHFGPEVGVSRTKKIDVPVVAHWLAAVQSMAGDLRAINPGNVAATVYHADARDLAGLLPPCSIDAVLTSPPYPNEKDYTRTTRLESVLLGFIHNKAELRALKKQRLLRSNTRTVYKDDNDDVWIANYPAIQSLAESIEQRRLALGKTSGFERLYARVTKLYFGGIARHLAMLRPMLKPGARLGYVVGDQASYLQVMIRTGHFLADIALSLGYQVESIDIFRTRLATATRQQLREEVVVLRWPGIL